MALVKLIRDIPEVPNGALTCETPEENLRECLSNGWKLADEKPSKPVKEEKVEKSEPAKVEEPKAEKVEEPKKAKKSL